MTLYKAMQRVKRLEAEWDSAIEAAAQIADKFTAQNVEAAKKANVRAAKLRGLPFADEARETAEVGAMECEAAASEAAALAAEIRKLKRNPPEEAAK